MASSTATPLRFRSYDDITYVLIQYNNAKLNCKMMAEMNKRVHKNISLYMLFSFIITVVFIMLICEIITKQ